MKRHFATLIGVGLLTCLPLLAQRGAPPQLLSCGPHADLEVLCGTQAPEDLELTPDGDYLILSQFAMAGNGAGMALFDLNDKTFTNMTIVTEPDSAWGAPSCPGPMTEPIRAHGISLGMHGGDPALYVVNHNGREAIEMFGLREAGNTWELVWHGCVVGSSDYNDVAILPDGGFVATRPTALQEPGGRGGLGEGVSGNVARWTPGQGETILPNSGAAYPNGVVADTDGRYAYIAAWTGREVRKYDLRTNTQVAIASLDFMPDNLTWTPDGQLLAAGIAGFGGAAGFGLARVNPESLEAMNLDQPADAAMAITGVSVGLEVGDAIYVGAYQGDRLVRIDRQLVPLSPTAPPPRD